MFLPPAAPQEEVTKPTFSWGKARLPVGLRSGIPHLRRLRSGCSVRLQDNVTSERIKVGTFHPTNKEQKTRAFRGGASPAPSSFWVQN